jgi:hypothetical protein
MLPPDLAEARFLLSPAEHRRMRAAVAHGQVTRRRELYRLIIT